MARTAYLTSESVSMGHPDKVADQISDAVLDACLKDDPHSRVACETLVTTGLCVVAGEITTKSWVNFPDIARKVMCEIGYDDDRFGINGQTCAVLATVDAQSPDIAMGVDNKNQGAGDQGMMFGYAIRETPELMPMPIMLAHKLVAELARQRQQGAIKWLRPDAKSQVTIQYKDGKPLRVDAVVISTQHEPQAKQREIKKTVVEKVIKKILPAKMIDSRTKFFVNPTGRFVIGGPHGDCGLTGRKIIVDTYGGLARHGGGAFSGKDPSKVDRSAAYAARYVAKNVVAARLADRCEVQVAYAIGVAKPVSVAVNTYGTGRIPEQKIEKIVRDQFDLTPAGIIKHLKLKRPIFRKTSYHGHFGRKGASFTWEKTDKVAALKRAAGL
jgi:S-adenosylmethionine synthetase